MVRLDRCVIESKLQGSGKPREVKANTILYVEDDTNDLFLLESAFRTEGANNLFRAARDGEEAIGYLEGKGLFADRTAYPLPMLVLLDLKMPKVDGLQVLRWVRTHREFKMLPVIMFSSSFLEPDIARSYSLGANSFIVKPTDLGELRQVARFLIGWLRHVRPPPADEREWVALKADELEARPQVE